MARRSVAVSAPLLAAMALAVCGGCRKPQMQRCVDELNRVVPDNLCQNQPHNQNSPIGGYVPIYRYYYGGMGGYDYGTIVNNGSYSPASGVSYTTRGGFGSSAGGAGGSDAAGHSSGGE